MASITQGKMHKHITLHNCTHASDCTDAQTHHKYTNTLQIHKYITNSLTHYTAQMPVAAAHSHLCAELVAIVLLDTITHSEDTCQTILL